MMSACAPYPSRVFIQMLESLAHILDVARASSANEEEDLARARLAPGMFDLSQHVELTCRHAIEASQRLAGRTVDAAFDFDDNDVSTLYASVLAAIARLEIGNAGSPGPEAFGRATTVTTTTGQVFCMSGQEMLDDWALPQFYFHLVTVYAILRHRGVDLGIRDYLGHMKKYLLAEPESAGPGAERQ